MNGVSWSIVATIADIGHCSCCMFFLPHFLMSDAPTGKLQFGSFRSRKLHIAKICFNAIWSPFQVVRLLSHIIVSSTAYHTAQQLPPFIQDAARWHTVHVRAIGTHRPCQT